MGQTQTRGSVGTTNAVRSPLKLEGVNDGSLLITSYRHVFEERRPGEVESRGRLPAVGSGRDRLTYRLKTTYPWKAVTERLVGQFPAVNVWQTSVDTLVASAVRWLFVSTDGGHSWRQTESLPSSSGPMGVLPTAFCEHDGSLYVGEYPLDSDATPRVLRSGDGGESWETLLALPDVRHVHGLVTDPYGGDLWMTTGDAGAECRIGRLVDGEFEALGAGGQRWRAVEPVFTPDGLFWGVDSVYTTSNAVSFVHRSAFEDADPAVEQVTTVDSSVYYGETFAVDGERWVVFATASEAGADSTAPDDRQVVHSGEASVVAASSATDYECWHELAAYEKQSVPGDARARLPTANAYVYLAADDERGLFVNPYNTATHAGQLRNFPLDYFAGLS